MRNLVFSQDNADEQAEFIQAFLETNIGERLVDADLEHTTGQIREATEAAYGLDFDLKSFCEIASQLYVLGELKPLPAPSVDRTPKDSLGRKLSPKALRWAEYRTWSNNPKVSTQEITARRQREPEFNEFYLSELQAGLKASAAAIPDAVSTAGEATSNKPKMTQELNDFALKFQSMPSDEVRRLKNAGTNPLGYQKFNKQMADCISLGII
jgi:hypothetical protein